MSVEKSGGEARSYAQIDKEAIEKFNKNFEISLEREARLHRHFEWRGGKMAPFNIEPFARERERLAGAGMSPEDRALRKQWLHDQELAPHEPIYIADLYPKNPIRRILAAPWNAVFGALKPVLGEQKAMVGRAWVPKIAFAVGSFYLIFYYMKYHQNNGVEKPAVKTDSDFYDRGFKHRTALRS